MRFQGPRRNFLKQNVRLWKLSKKKIREVGTKINIW